MGFVVSLPEGRDAVYVTGDTVWYEGIAEVARRFRPVVAVLFAGAARTRGPFHLTMDCNDALEAARAFPAATSWEFTTKAGRISPRTPHPLQAEDVARCVRFALCQPAHVRIPRLMVLPGEHVI